MIKKYEQFYFAFCRKESRNEFSSVNVPESVEELQSSSFKQNLEDTIQNENCEQEEIYDQSSQEAEKISFEKKY